MTIIQLICTAILACAAPPAIDSRSFGDRDPVPFEPQDARSHGVFGLQDFNDALTRMELASAIANLPIDEGVRWALVACVAEHYPKYLTAHDTVVARHAKYYIGICQKQAAEFEPEVHGPLLEEVQERDHEADVVRRELKAAERDFILVVQDCLDEALVSIERPQAMDDMGTTVLEPLALKAQRRYTEVDMRPRGDSLELRDMVNGLGLGDTVRKSVEPELLNYERALAVLKPAQCKANNGSPLRVALYEAGRIAAGGWPSAGRIGIQIRRAAQASASRIAALLPDSQRQTFETEVYRGIFPELADDPKGDALGKDFTAALARTDLSGDAAERLLALQEYWNLEHKSWRMKAEEHLLDWWDRMACWQGNFAPQYIEPMRVDLLREQAELHNRWRSILADQLPMKIAP